MTTNSVSFPHPVLGASGGVSLGEYVANAEYSAVPGSQYIRVSVIHTLTNPAIELLLQQKKACFVVEINCSATLYRTVHKSSEKIQSFDVPAQCIIDKCTVDFFVVADVEIDDYQPTGMRPEYGNETFGISRGDVLAVASRGIFMVGRRWKQKNELQSIFSIKQDASSEVKIQFGTQSIIILLNKKDFENLKATATIFPRSYVASLYLPALMEALSLVVTGDIDELFPAGRPVWWDAIEIKKQSIKEIKDTALSKKNILSVAQYLLDLPITHQGEELVERRKRMSKDN